MVSLKLAIFFNFRENPQLYWEIIMYKNIDFLCKICYNIIVNNYLIFANTGRPFLRRYFYE